MTAPNDTRPTPLPAARLAEIREALAAFEACPVASALQDDAAYDCARALGEVLAHLDALTAPAPADGGEALGRGLFFALHPGGDLVWKHYEDESKAPWIAAALALDAHGYARGFAAGADLASETTRHLIEARDLAQRTAEIAHTEIARLTAELAEARAAEARSVDALNAAIRMHHEGVEERAEAESAARREGAREEREAIETFLRVEMHNSERAGQAEEERALYDALDWVRTRGDAAPVEGEDGAT